MKKLLALLVSLVMVVSIVGPALAAAPLEGFPKADELET